MRCSTPICERPLYAKGLCQAHWHRVNIWGLDADLESPIGCHVGNRKVGLDPVAQPTMQAIAWAAGIFEGEGSTDKHGTVAIVQKDPWILHRLCSLFGGEVKPYKWKPQAKLYYHWRLHGGRARGFLLTIFTYLSPRRHEQIKTNISFKRKVAQCT